MVRILQEFYCGTCKGYFLLNVNKSLDDHEVEIQCSNPDCKHVHRRRIFNGVIKEEGRYREKPKEKLISLKSTYSKTPRTQKMKTAQENGNNTYARCDLRREAVPLCNPLQEGVNNVYA